MNLKYIKESIDIEDGKYSNAFLKAKEFIEKGNIEAIRFINFQEMSEDEKISILDESFKRVRSEGKIEGFLEVFERGGKFGMEGLISCIARLGKEAKDLLRPSQEEIKKIDFNKESGEWLYCLIRNFFQQFIFDMKIELVGDTEIVKYHLKSPVEKEKIKMTIKL